MSSPPNPPAPESLATPLAWLDADGRVLGCNPAFASWLGVSARRLVGMALPELDAEGDRVAGLLPRLLPTGEPLRVRRARLAFPGNAERFADVWLARTEDGGLRLEAHPADEFPGEDPATALPAALSAALKGLAHEIRNPLAGLKGAAQLLAKTENSPANKAGSQACIAVVWPAMSKKIIQCNPGIAYAGVAGRKALAVRQIRWTGL